MIQRKQSLFLFQLIILGIALLFIPVCTVFSGGRELPVYLVKLDDAQVHSTAGHQAAIALNFLALILASITIFLFNNRSLQLKMCWVQVLLWLMLALMIAFCPFLESDDHVAIQYKVNYFAVVLAALGIVGAYMAARFIKKDIELLKSADRIR